MYKFYLNVSVSPGLSHTKENKTTPNGMAWVVRNKKNIWFHRSHCWHVCRWHRIVFGRLRTVLLSCLCSVRVWVRCEQWTQCATMKKDSKNVVAGIFASQKCCQHRAEMHCILGNPLSTIDLLFCSYLFWMPVTFFSRNSSHRFINFMATFREFVEWMNSGRECE